MFLLKMGKAENIKLILSSFEFECCSPPGIFRYKIVDFLTNVYQN